MHVFAFLSIYAQVNYFTCTGLKVKRWPKLCKIRPDELRKVVTAKLLESACKIVHISNERDLKNILIAERRRRSIYVREERSKSIEAKVVCIQVKRVKRLARKRAVDKAKREAAAESCRGLPRSLVPTNIPEKYGATEECYKVSYSDLYWLVLTLPPALRSRQ